MGADVFESLAKRLYQTKSVILAGGAGGFDGQGTLTQVIVAYSNLLIGAYGSILSLHHGWQIPPVK